MDDYYLSLNYSPAHLLDTMYDEASHSENYYLSPVNVLRCDVSDYLRSELSKIFNVPFNDCGFLKTKPNSTYPLHQDAYRICAINLLLSDFDVNFTSKVLVIDRSPKLEMVPYQTNHFLMLNVMKPHMVENKSLDKERIVLSIGFKNYSYSSMIDMFREGKLLNVL